MLFMLLKFLYFRFFFNIVFKNILEGISPSDHCFRLLMIFAMSGSLHLCALSPVCNELLRFTSGATPADLLATSMVAEPF